MSVEEGENLVPFRRERSIVAPSLSRDDQAMEDSLAAMSGNLMGMGESVDEYSPDERGGPSRPDFKVIEGGLMRAADIKIPKP